MNGGAHAQPVTASIRAFASKSSRRWSWVPDTYQSSSQSRQTITTNSSVMAQGFVGGAGAFSCAFKSPMIAFSPSTWPCNART